MKFRKSIIFTLMLVSSTVTIAQHRCIGNDKSKWTGCVGRVTTAKGQIYSGDYQNGKRTGKGTYSYPSGLRYEGDFINGLFDGYGTLTYSDGSKYVGVFNVDKKNGAGTEYNTRGEVSRAGIWKDDDYLDAVPDTQPVASKNKYSVRKAVDASDALLIEWLSQSETRRTQYNSLVQYLTEQKVLDVIPTWQLLTPDIESSTELCPIDTFVIPPKELWPNAVPTLQLIRSHVIPYIGPVRMVSGYRPPTFNKCIGGAKNSVHMTFSGFDIVPVQFIDTASVFGKMCSQWALLPTNLKFGLGAYFDPLKNLLNSAARIHVDTFGRRTWGYDYTFRSSYCNHLPI